MQLSDFIPHILRGQKNGDFSQSPEKLLAQVAEEEKHLHEQVQSRISELTGKMPEPFTPPGQDRSDFKTREGRSIYAQIQMLQLGYYKAAVKEWLAAVDLAMSDFNPRRNDLMRVYQNALMDEHLPSVVEARILRVLGSKWRIKNTRTGDAMPEVEKLIRKAWFRKVMKEIINSRFYGHSLIEIGAGRGTVEYVYLVPRTHVVPERGLVLQSEYDLDGIDYLQPIYSDILIEVGDVDDLGLLLQASLAALKKKSMDQAWIDFGNIFGVPLRIGKTASRNPADLNAIDKFLANMGRKAWARFPSDTDIEIKENAKQDAHKVFSEYMDRMDRGMSKRILGATMITDNGSSLSQSKVHDELADDLLAADKELLLETINEKLFPLLIRQGFPLAGCEFEWDDPSELALKDQWAIDQGLLQLGYLIPVEYLTNTYGVPIDAAPDRTPPPAPATRPGAQGQQGFTTLPQASAAAGANLMRSISPTPAAALTAQDTPDPALLAAYEAAVKAVWDKRKGSGHRWDDNMWAELNRVLTSALEQGYDKPVLQFDHVDFRALALLKSNVSVFSAAKTYEELKVLTDLLYEGDQIRSFAAFQEEARKIYSQYNGRYLQAEYQHAIACGQGSRMWQDAVRDKEVLPLLMWDAVLDRRTRPEHAMLDGVTLPVDDPFWNTHWVPFGWGCRCAITQLAEGRISPIIPTVDSPAMFRTNVGKTGIAFPDIHPYYASTRYADMQARRDNAAGAVALAKAGSFTEFRKSTLDFLKALPAMQREFVAADGRNLMIGTRAAGWKHAVGFSNKNQAGKYMALHDIEELFLARAEYLRSEEDTKGRKADITWHYLGCEWQDYEVEIIVRETQQGDTYIYDISLKQKKPSGQ